LSNKELDDKIAKKVSEVITKSSEGEL
jgi:hypothetical protein